MSGPVTKEMRDANGDIFLVRYFDTGAGLAARPEAGADYVAPAVASITAGGTAQTLFAANPARDHLFIGNPNLAGSLWVNDLGGTAAPNAAGSTEIAPGVTARSQSRAAISIWGATTGLAITAGEG